MSPVRQLCFYLHSAVFLFCAFGRVSAETLPASEAVCLQGGFCLLQIAALYISFLFVHFPECQRAR